ncbi:sensor histidine kinase regulating citrate/malate metabolism [Streptomyces sp. 1114.5]|uniref:sensor histidine kinase n=1 Tax=Streptomyces sp. 1114.5 TaxID=1938830 RepID=UPI000EAEECCD|nr:ATP-binding protein [Streptomyces sp. 1114.5]RKT11658.1 sensor histidine kinase regulating citrate/malate metabolism [Streptomyces sp. 1114.5]
MSERTAPTRSRRRWPPLPHRLVRSLAGQLFVVQVVIVAAVVAGGAVLAYLFTAGRAEDAARREVTAVAHAVAQSPSVRAAVTGPDPTAVLQPYVEQVRTDTGVSFITVMDTDGVRWTHPLPEQIGKRYLGHIDWALAGQTRSETYTGTLGPSVRVVTPVWDDRHRVVALVSAGITVQSISAQLSGPLLALVGVAVAALALGGAGTYLANSRLRRHTHGMGPDELSHLYEYHQATLHSVREGLVLLDRSYRVVLCNDAARELLGLDGEVDGRPVADLGLPEALVAAVLGREAVRDEVHLTDERVVVLNTSTIGTGLGRVVTLRDHTELQALSGELDSVRGFTDALGAQAHEAANRLHAVVSLIELGRHEQAVELATAELELAQQLTDRVVAAVGEPVLAALLLGKAAQAAERGVELSLTEDSRIDDGVLPPGLSARDLITVLGNLIDNAVDAAIAGAAQSPVPPEVTVTARIDGDGGAARGGAAGGGGDCLLLRVADTGAGIDPAAVEDVFRRGWSTKQDGRGHGLGLALVAQAARRNGGTVEVGRERGAVLTVRLPLAGRDPGGRSGSGDAGSCSSGGRESGEPGGRARQGALA